MGFRFQRRLKLFPGVRLNFSRGGISTTIGVRGASVTLGGRGAYVNLGIPGTGLSFRQRITPGADGRQKVPVQPPDRSPGEQLPPSPSPEPIRTGNISGYFACRRNPERTGQHPDEHRARWD